MQRTQTGALTADSCGASFITRDTAIPQSPAVKEMEGMGKKSIGVTAPERRRPGFRAILTSSDFSVLQGTHPSSWWMGDASLICFEQRFPFRDRDGQQDAQHVQSNGAGRTLQHDGKQLPGNAIFYSAHSLQNYSLSVL